MAGRLKIKKRFFSGFLAFTLTVSAVYVPPAFSVSADITDNTERVAYEEEANAASDQTYDEFGFALESPGEFNPKDTSNPLDGYEPITLSELYVGDMNRDSNWKGSFKVMENVTSVDADSLSFKNMGKTTVGAEVSFNGYYPANKDKYEIQTHNAIAIDADGDGNDEILDVMLYARHDKNKVSYADVCVYDLVDGVWKSGAKKTYQLSDNDSNTRDFVLNIEADSSKGFTALAAGDYDGDGKDEAAVYIPSKRDSNGAFVAVLDVDADEKLTEKGKIYLKSLNNGNNRFNFKYEKEYLPLVSLATTSISGQDDLFISANHSMDDDKDTNPYGHESAFGIYHYNESTLSCRYSDTSMRYKDTAGKKYRMRFSSAVDGDVNGNGVEELIIGGYMNVDWDDLYDPGKLSDKYNCIQLLYWNTESKKYEKIWSQPKLVPAFSELSTSKELMEPAAIAAGVLDAGETATQVFLEGVVLRIQNLDHDAKTEIDSYKNANFAEEYTISLKGDNDAFISSAYAATFSDSAGSTEQLVILAGDHVSVNNDQIYYDIIWVWQSNGSLTSKVTNNDYMSKCNEDDNGTFISICPIDADKDMVYVKYTGKTCGWSAPELYCILQSIPYWKELTYVANAPGTTSYTITYGSGYGEEESFSVTGGAFLDVSAMWGAGFMGTKGMFGGGLSAGFLLGYLKEYSDEHKEIDSIELVVSAGKDYAVLFAMPAVYYHYEMWIPPFTVTQEYIDNYKTLEGKDCPYKVGETGGGEFQPSNIYMTYEPSISCIELDKYNQLAEKYKDHENIDLKPITEDMLPQKTIGDPTTYPQNVNELMERGNIIKDSVHLSQVANVTTQEVMANIDYTVEETYSSKQGLRFNFDAAFYLKGAVHTKAAFFFNAQMDLQAGIQIQIGVDHTWVDTSINGTSYSSSIRSLPKDTPSCYNYSAQMAVYQMNDGSNLADEEEYPYAIGFIVKQTDEVTAPPSVPKNLRVFAASKDKVVLAWDKNSYRSAQSYEIFIKDNLGNTISVGKTSDLYFIAEELKSETAYEFAVKAYSEANQTGTESVLSPWIIAVTKSTDDDAPVFEISPENVIILDEKELPTLTSLAKAGIEGVEIIYQWQIMKDGTWINIKGATEKDYAIPALPEEDAMYYRVVATQRKASNVQSIVSRTAAIFKNADEARMIYTLDADITLTGEDSSLIMEDNGKYHVAENSGNLICRIQFINEKNPKAFPTGDLITVVCRGEDGLTVEKIGKIREDGSVEVELSKDEMKEGIYTIYVEYAGNQKDTVYYMPIRSPEIQLSAVRMYQMQYNLDGGMNHPCNPTVLTSQNGIVVLQNAEKRGYTFEGWYLDLQFEEKIGVSGISASELFKYISESGMIEFYAKYTPIRYSIHYVLNGGTNGEGNPDSYTIEDKNLKFNKPVRDGYEFRGWYTDAQYAKSFNRAEFGGIGDVTVYALWEKISVSDSSQRDNSEGDNSEGDDSQLPPENEGDEEEDADQNDNPDTPKPPEGNSPQTGDDTPSLLFVLMMIASLVTLGLAMVLKNSKDVVGK